MLSFFALRDQQRRASKSRKPIRRLGIEQLEVRATPATLTVTSFSDVVNPGDDATVFTLREAMIRANQDALADTIVFDPIVFGTPRTIALTSAAASGQGLPAITSDLTIQGPGVGLLTITRQTAVVDFRIFTVNQNVGVTISGLTVTNPTPTLASSTFTGGLFNLGGRVLLQNVVFTGNVSNLGGAAIFNSGLMELRDSTVASNTAADRGGGIVNEGQLLVNRSTINDNFSNLYGGGIYNEGFLSVTNSTVARNLANRWGGGISNGDFTVGNFEATMISVNSTIVLNRADANGDNNVTDIGGGIYTEINQNTALDNTIVAGNLRGLANSNVFDDLNGGIVQIGSAFNVIGDPNTAGGLVDGVLGNIVGLNGGVLPLNTILINNLANYGGPTNTYALRPGSPALNNGVTSFMVTPMRVLSLTANLGPDTFPSFQLINNSGLSNIPTVATLPTTTHATADSGTTAWVTNSSATPDYYDDPFVLQPALTFDLGGTVNLTDMVVWGYVFTGPNNNEARAFQVSFSIDGGNTFGPSIFVSQAARSGLNNTQLSFNGTFAANVVRVQILDNFFGFPGGIEGFRVGLGEVKFIAAAPPIDQRGVIRTVPYDIGSFEGNTRIVLSNNTVVENVPGAIVGRVSVLNGVVGANFNYNVSDGRFVVVNNELRLLPGVSVSRAVDGLTITLDITATNSPNPSVTQTFVINVIANNFPWHNFVLPEDANDDGARNIDDAIFIIRLLRRGDGGPLPPTRPPTAAGGHWGDVFADNILDIRDAVAVIRFLRIAGGTSTKLGEGESAESVAAPTSTAWDLAWASWADGTNEKKSRDVVALA